jgi:DnaA family protein
MKQLALDIAPLPTRTLDNFIPGRNAELVVALYALANGASVERFIYLWGATGSGRSHLLRATVAGARLHGRIAAVLGADIDPDGIAGDALVAADDVNLLDEDAQISLFRLHNRLRASGGRLIAAGDVPPARLALRPDLATRLASGLVYEVHELGDDEKAAALRRHAAARGFELSQDVTDYVLKHAQRDMPSLLALLDALDRFSLETKRAVTVPLLRELIPSLVSARAARSGCLPLAPRGVEKKDES